MCLGISARFKGLFEFPFLSFFNKNINKRKTHFRRYTDSQKLVRRNKCEWWTFFMSVVQGHYDKTTLISPFMLEAVVNETCSNLHALTQNTNDTYTHTSATWQWSSITSVHFVGLWEFLRNCLKNKGKHCHWKILNGGLNDYISSKPQQDVIRLSISFFFLNKRALYYE